MLVGCAYTPLVSPSDFNTNTDFILVSEVTTTDLRLQYDTGYRASTVGAMISGGVGAVVGMLIDAAIIQEEKAKNEIKVEPYRNMVSGVDAPGLIHAGLESALSESALPTRFKFHNLRDGNLSIEHYLDNLGTEKLLHIKTDYFLDSDENVLHIVSDAVLYLEKLKERESVGGTYYKVGWRAHYQSPMRASEVLMSTPERKRAEIEGIERHYNELIESSKTSQINHLRKLRNKKVKRSKKFNFVFAKPPVRRMQWDSIELTKNLVRGIDFTSRAVLYPLFHVVSNKEFEDNAIDVPYLAQSNDNGVPVFQKRAANIDILGVPDYSTYMTRSNNIHIVYKDDVIQLY